MIQCVDILDMVRYAKRKILSGSSRDHEVAQSQGAGWAGRA